MSENTNREEIERLIEELRAKAWQSSSRRNAAGGLSKHSDHVTWRAADALSALLAQVEEQGKAMEGALFLFPLPGEDSLERFERIAEAFYRETRMLAPGKSEPLDMSYEGRDEERRARFDQWVAERVATARAALPSPPAVVETTSDGSGALARSQPPRG